MFDDVGDLGPARGDAGDRRDMVGLERVLHAQQKSEPRIPNMPTTPVCRPTRSQTSPGVTTARLAWP